MRLEDSQNNNKDAVDFLPGALESALTSKKIPALEPQEMSALLHHMFHQASSSLRIRVAEVVFRYERGHRHGLDLFLACVLPLAERAARRRAARFLHPSEWRLEVMYDGAVSLVIEMFQHGEVCGTDEDGFRRYLLRTLTYGTLRYFTSAGSLQSRRETVPTPLKAAAFQCSRTGYVLTTCPATFSRVGSNCAKGAALLAGLPHHAPAEK